MLQQNNLTGPAFRENKTAFGKFCSLLAPCVPSGPALSAAVSSSLSQNIAEVVGQAGAAPLTSLQIHFIQNMIHETLEDFRLVFGLAG